MRLILFLALTGSCFHLGEAVIDRERIVRTFNVRRNESSEETPLQVGNGNFAFGADITGLQTFRPYGIMSSWGWHNASLPATAGQTNISDFTGLEWWTHERLVDYNMPNPAESDISQWLIANPNRLNLGRIGFYFENKSIQEENLKNKTQLLDIWSGKLLSSFVLDGSRVDVTTTVDPDQDVIAITVESDLLSEGKLGIFFDFPYPDLNKFDAPFVGVWNNTQSTTTLQNSQEGTTIRQKLGNNIHYLHVKWDGPCKISGPFPETNKYILKRLPGSKTLHLSTLFTTEKIAHSVKTTSEVERSAARWWNSYWTSGAFLDISATGEPNAIELQRRIILSQYLLAVNSASEYEPQESGLVNNGWYGKFHLEMYFWHTAHFARWNHFDLFQRSQPSMYQKFLPASYERASNQGYRGARWGKMSDPTGRSAPGEINSLLIWQQPHPMYFAETEFRAFPTSEHDTLIKWDEIITATADFMASYAWFNKTTGVYDLGPPMYTVSETTNPNATINPTFEIAYWRFGLDVASRWKQRQGKPVPREWQEVLDKIAPLATFNGTFSTYEGISDMWIENSTIQSHPAMAGIYGWLPQVSSGPPLDMTVVRKTAETMKDKWQFTSAWGWDFPLLAMNSLRLGNTDQAIAYLMHENFQFDDAGYPIGGSNVPTPYFPSAGGLLLAAAMLAGGWDGSEGSHFPGKWAAVVEGFLPAI